MEIGIFVGKKKTEVKKSFYLTYLVTLKTAAKKTLVERYDVQSKGTLYR